MGPRIFGAVIVTMLLSLTVLRCVEFRKEPMEVRSRVWELVEKKQIVRWLSPTIVVYKMCLIWKVDNNEKKMEEVTEEEASHYTIGVKIINRDPK